MGVIDAGAKAAVMIEIRRDVLGGGPGSRLWGTLTISRAESLSYPTYSVFNI
jgi:hypothetical protein